MPNICKNLALEEADIKFVDQGARGIFEGYGSVFNVLDSDGDIILPGAFKSTLANATRPVSMFFNHRARDLPIGRWTHIEEDSKGLYVRGELTPGHAQADAIKASMLHKTVGGLSVGFGFTRDDYSRTATGKAFKNISALREISVCTWPANEQASIFSMKSLDCIETIRDIEAWLRDSAGLSKSEAQAFITCAKSAIRRDSESRNTPDYTALAALIEKTPL